MFDKKEYMKSYMKNKRNGQSNTKQSVEDISPKLLEMLDLLDNRVKMLESMLDNRVKMLESMLDNRTKSNKSLTDLLESLKDRLKQVEDIVYDK